MTTLQQENITNVDSERTRAAVLSTAIECVQPPITLSDAALFAQWLELQSEDRMSNAWAKALSPCENYETTPNLRAQRELATKVFTQYKTEARTEMNEALKKINALNF